MNRPIGPLLVVSILTFVLVTAAASAATRTVTSNADDGGPGTLRSQVAAAAAGDTVEFAVTGSIVLTQGEILLDKDLTIQGPGRDQLAIDGGGAGDRLFEVARGSAIALRDVSLVNGGRNEAGYVGGAVLNQGRLVLDADRLTDNLAGDPGGGAIYNAAGASLSVLNSDFSGNGPFQAGSLYNAGQAMLRGSSFAPLAMDQSGVSGTTFYNEGSLHVEQCVLSPGGVPDSSVIENRGSLEIVGSMLAAGCLILENRGDAGISDSEIPFSAPCGQVFDGVRNFGTLRIRRTSLSGADSLTAGIWNSGQLLLTESAVFDNLGQFWAGVFNEGDLIVSNSTITGNGANDGSAVGGSALTSLANSTTYVSFSTVVSPDLHPQAGENAVAVSAGDAIRASNSILAQTRDGCEASATCVRAGSCSGSIVDLGGNVSNDSSCGASFRVAEPGLLALASNGGPTPTRALAAGSPALDEAASCTWDDDADPQTPEVPALADQRGWGRPAGSACDSGAYEDASAPLPRVVGHRVLDCTAQQDIATLADGESFTVDLAYVAQPVCLGVGVLVEANASSGDGSVGYAYTPAAGETVTSPYEGESSQPFALMGDYGWAVPGEIAACHCDAPERGELALPGLHTTTSTPCSADAVGWSPGDKAAQCVAAAGVAGQPFTTSLDVVPEPNEVLGLAAGILLLRRLSRRRSRKRARDSG